MIYKDMSISPTKSEKEEKEINLKRRRKVTRHQPSSNPNTLLLSVSAAGDIVHVAPLLGDGLTLDTPLQHTLTLLAQAGAGVDLGAVLSLVVDASAPPDLGGGAGAGPDDVVDAGRVDGLGPDGELAAQNVLLGVLGDAVGRVVAVHEAPALGGGAPVVEGVEHLGGLALGHVEPLAATTVKVLHGHVSSALMRSLSLSLTHEVRDVYKDQGHSRRTRCCCQ